MRRTILILGLLLTAGCGPLWDQPGEPKPDVSVVTERAPAAEIWRALAHDVEASVIQSPKELARYVKCLRESGDLSSDDQAEFDRQFIGASKDTSEFSDRKAAAEKLRGLK
jgi:hypothetical protein